MRTKDQSPSLQNIRTVKFHTQAEGRSMNSRVGQRASSILLLLGGSFEFSIAFPETFRPPTEPDALVLTLFSMIIIVCGIMLYSTPRLRILWGLSAIAMALLVIVVGSPLEGFEIFGPPTALTGGILATLDQVS